MPMEIDAHDLSWEAKFGKCREASRCVKQLVAYQHTPKGSPASTISVLLAS
jgi:hypothetical protein